MNERARNDPDGGITPHLSKLSKDKDVEPAENETHSPKRVVCGYRFPTRRVLPSKRRALMLQPGCNPQVVPDSATSAPRSLKRSQRSASMALRPDAVLQGTGCLIMAGTAAFVVHALMYGSEVLDVAVPSSFPVVVLPLLLLVPCCVGSGALMLWSGFGGRFPVTSAGFRCDLPPREDRGV